MSQVSEPQLLAFLDVIKMGDKSSSVRGGALITDNETKPYEFRCTGPVRPTELQRILYGATLNEYIFVDLLGAPLLRAAKEKPVLVIVRNEILLRVRPTVEYPVVVLKKSEHTGTSSGYGGVSMRTHPDFPGEVEAAQAILNPLIGQRDIFEPFDRLHMALQEAHRQGIADKQGGDV
jgi:hypothetical protein